MMNSFRVNKYIGVSSEKTNRLRLKEVHMQNDEQEIRQLVATWMSATKSGDVKAVLEKAEI